LTVDRTAMYPDHYIGAVHLTMEGGLERLTVPVDLSVRAGPIWVIPALLTGIVLGQVVRVVEESKANTTSPITGNWREQIKGRLKRLSEQVFGKEFDVLQLFIKLALLLGLLAVGVETLYVNQGLTFGANPVSDYSTLVVWGLSADVASRSLTKLRP
jgi:hypothetical protein